MSMLEKHGPDACSSQITLKLACGSLAAPEILVSDVFQKCSESGEYSAY